MASRLVEPGEQLARYLFPIGLIEELVAGLWIKAACDTLKTGSAIGGKKFPPGLCRWCWQNREYLR